ncbi:uncharacterized protein LOC122635530 [Vespula pensylvanica]|uniref:Chitin-binding type-2 domain-containing protein n=1 Tax=Vespula pensylvanica TaxID=30213 RepID=A0A834K4F4_VESPE|nr:uncharacterized protein LOC122635530 [Vespula pensylvanica]KAF7400028.1 hypothetical protein H0235_015765 [Vespula pensylvanica]
MKRLLALQCILLFAVTVYAGPPLGIPEEDLSEQCQTPLCPVNRNSETVNLPYPLDCLLYISCGEKETIETCPDNLVFNKKTGLCDTPANAQCVPCWQQPSPY